MVNLMYRIVPELWFAPDDLLDIVYVFTDTFWGFQEWHIIQIKQMLYALPEYSLPFYDWYR